MKNCAYDLTQTKFGKELIKKGFKKIRWHFAGASNFYVWGLERTNTNRNMKAVTTIEPDFNKGFSVSFKVYKNGKFDEYKSQKLYTKKFAEMRAFVKKC